MSNTALIFISEDVDAKTQTASASDHDTPFKSGPPKLHFDTRHGDDQFYKSIKKRFDRYLRMTGQSRFANSYILLKASIYAFISIGSYISLLVFSKPEQPILALFLGFLSGLTSLLLVLNVAHDATHQCVSRYRIVNHVIYTLSFALLGVSGYLWQLRHNRSHHIFPNVNGCDVDIDQNPFLRLSPNHKKQWYQRFQHYYAPFIYWFVALHTIFFQDFIYLYKKNLANMMNIKHSQFQIALFFILKAAYLVLMFGLPLALLPFNWKSIACGYLLITFVLSLIFILLLIGTHFAMETEFPMADHGRLPTSWAAHALRTSLDWNPTNKFAIAVVGGLNAHSAHHLFPGVSHAHCQVISRIVQKAALRHGITYNAVTLPRMIVSHFAFLRKLALMD